jgi:hypothetical protein
MGAMLGSRKARALSWLILAFLAFHVNKLIVYDPILSDFSYNRSMDSQIRNAAFICLEEQTMLKHGIQFLDNNKIILPTSKKNGPDRERPGVRFEEFLKTG